MNANSEILDRLPPQDIEAEKAVLGSILLEPRIVDDVGSLLGPDDFYSEGNAVIYGHLIGMAQADKQIDSRLLIDRLRASDDLGRVGGMEYLATVVQSVAVHQHYRSYAGIVLRNSRLRKVIHLGCESLKSAYATGADPEDILSSMELALDSIHTGDYQTDPVPLAEAIERALKKIKEVVNRGASVGILTGLSQVDEELGGFFPGELSVIAARTSQGKTTLASQLAAYMASRGRVVYFATLEMKAHEIATKQLCAIAGFDSNKIRAGKVMMSDYNGLAEAGVKFRDARLYMHDWPEIRPFDIRRAARRVKADIIFVDYLQIVSPQDGDKKRQQRYEQVGAVSRQLKVIAGQLDIPIVACAQLGRQAAEKGEVPPKLHHLRESGNIEQDIDMALLLWNPDGKCYKGTPEECDAVLDFAKNRKGLKRKYRLSTDPVSQMFTLCGTNDKPRLLSESGVWDANRELSYADQHDPDPDRVIDDF